MEYTIGRRDSNKADILIEHKTISGIHAKVWFNNSNGTFWIEDLNSLNHTYISRSGQKTKVTSSMQLLSSDIVFFGRKEIPFYVILEKINSEELTPKSKNNDSRDSSKSVINIERCLVCGTPKTIGQRCTKTTKC